MAGGLALAVGRPSKICCLGGVPTPRANVAAKGDNAFRPTQLGFSSSSFFQGINISKGTTLTGGRISIAPSTSPFQPIVARRVCPFTGKKPNRANNVSFSQHRTKKVQSVNLQYKRIWWEGGKRFVKLRLSANAMKTIEKNGLEAMAKKAGIDLSKTFSYASLHRKK